MFDPLPSDIFHSGQLLNNTYEIDGVLGRGGTGEVYLARNQVTGRMVAIKALNQQFSEVDAYGDLLRRELQMRDILDDAVVRYTECSRSAEGHVFLVMDYVDGPSIGEVMHQRRLEPRELMIIAHRVAEGLMAAHAKGIVHRDLSPDNVILRGGTADRATIIDFGIAKDTAADARSIFGNEFAGKYEYAAPEQLEGRAEPRSDLYALGAMLLAAYRGQIPFAGATPGEMVRRKLRPLDSDGTPEPLRGLIDWLTKPKLTERAPSAEAVVARLNIALGTQNRSRAQQNFKGRSRQEVRSRRWPLSIAVLLLCLTAGSAAYFTGQFERVFPPSLPTAAPYTFSASAPDQGKAKLSGNAPDVAGAGIISQAYEVLTHVRPAPLALTLAKGVPDANWPQAVADGLADASGIEDWVLEISDMKAKVTGVAPDRATRDATSERLTKWAQQNGFTLSLALQTGPRTLSGTQIDGILAKISDCGPLDRGPSSLKNYALEDTIHIFGNVAETDQLATIEKAIRDIAGDRNIDLSVAPLTRPVCKIRQLLPKAPANGLSILLTQGSTGELNPAGVFHVGDNPVIQVLVPTTYSGSSLSVFVVQEDGGVLSLMPTAYHDNNQIDGLGTVAGTIRAVTVAYPAQQTNGAEKLIKLVINNSSFGKSEIVAILSRDDLFALRRPGQETADGLAVALAGIQDSVGGNVLAMATAFLDSMP